MNATPRVIQFTGHSQSRKLRELKPGGGGGGGSPRYRQIFRVRRNFARHASHRGYSRDICEGTPGKQREIPYIRRKQTIFRYRRDILIRFSNPPYIAAAVFAKLVLCSLPQMQSLRNSEISRGSKCNVCIVRNFPYRQYEYLIFLIRYPNFRLSRESTELPLIGIFDINWM